MPSLSSLRAQEKPGVEESMMNAVMPFEPASGTVLAYTIMVCASGPYIVRKDISPLEVLGGVVFKAALTFVIHIFVPFNL